MSRFCRADGRSVWRWWVSFIVFLAFAWRVLGLDAQSLWRDEIDAIFFSQQHLPVLLSMFTNPGQNGALYYLVLRPWFALVGTSEFALRFPSVVASVLCIPLLWQVGRRLMPASKKMVAGGQPVAIKSEGDLRGLLSTIMCNPPLLATLFLAVNPYQLWYAQEGKMYALVTFLALLATWFWLRGIGRGGWQPWLGLLVTTSLAIYSHLLMVLFIPLLVVWFLLAWPQSKMHRRGFALVLGGLSLPYVPLLWWQWPMLTGSRISTALSFTPLGTVLKSVLLYQSHSILPPDHLAWLAPFFILGLNGLLIGYRAASLQPDRVLPHLPIWRRHLLIGAWLIIPILVIYLLSLRQPVFMPRYVIWIAPALMMLVAMGMHVVWQNSSRRMRPFALLLIIFLLGYWIYIGWNQKTVDLKADLRGAIGYVSQRRQPDELLILQIPHLEYAYRYYSRQEGGRLEGSDEQLGRWSGGPTTNNGLSYEEAWRKVDEEMRAKTEGAAHIWVLQSEARLRDERDLMGEWLNENAVLIEELAFHQVEVQVYQK